MNWKGIGKKWSWPKWGTTQYLPGGTEGNITVMVVSVPAKKQNEHILNTGHQDHYCYATDL
jgi:hypothetical protein